MLARRGESTKAAENDESEGDSALDVIGQLLRTFGQESFELGERSASALARECEAWAQHVLLLRPAPGETEATVPPSGRRDFFRLRQFFDRERQREAGWVRQAFGGMRQIFGAFTASLSRAVAVEAQADVVLRERLETLEAALALPIDQLRQQATVAIREVDRLLEERAARQRAQVEELSVRLQQMGTELEQARHERATDELTRLYNRRALADEIANAVADQRQRGETTSLLMLDIDHFKQLNDEHGHRAGDAVLAAFARKLAVTFPRKRDTVARWGGEEFAVVLRDAALGDAKRLGERLLAAVRDMVIEHEGRKLIFTVSAGVAEVDARDDGASWLERADQALYAAKRNGRDRLVIG